MHCVFFCYEDSSHSLLPEVEIGVGRCKPSLVQTEWGCFLCVIYSNRHTQGTQIYIRIVFTCSGGVFFLGGKTAANPTLLHWPHSVSCISFFSSSTLGDVDILASGTKEM